MSFTNTASSTAALKTAVTTAFRWFDRYTLETLNVLPLARTGREPLIRALEDPSSIGRPAWVSGRR